MLVDHVSENQHFDVAIIGAGTGGYSAALRLAELGKSVVLIEEDARPGGVCLHEGCIPSKALLRAAEVRHLADSAATMGMDYELKSFDFGRLVSYKEAAIEQMTSGLEQLLHARKVTFVQAWAEVTQPHQLTLHLPQGQSESEGQVDGEASGQTADQGQAEDDSQANPILHLHATDIIIATGSHPRELDGVPISHKAILDSTDAMNLQQIPHSVVILGSGPIGLEFATLWSSQGADVTILATSPRIFPRGSRRISALMAREMKRRGIHIHTSVDLHSLTEGDNQSVTVRYSSPDSTTHTPIPPTAKAPEGGEQTVTLTAQFALVAKGRVPNTAQPWMSKLGVNLDSQGLVVTDPYGRTSVEHVWAVGDITPGKQLAHRAFAQGICVAETICGLDSEPVDDYNVPSVTFSQPEIAQVGYSGEEAKANPQFSEIQETSLPMMGNARVFMSQTAGTITVVSGIREQEPDKRVVLGVEMVGPHVTELVAEAEQLVGNHVGVHEASALIHPHPTFSETLGEALLKADGRPLHSR